MNLTEIENLLADIYTKTGVRELGNAISMAHVYFIGTPKRELLNELATIYRSECSGEIVPSLEIRTMYSKLARKKVIYK